MMTIKTRNNSESSIATETEATTIKMNASDAVKRKTLTRSRKSDVGKVSQGKSVDTQDPAVNASAQPVIGQTTGVEWEGLDRAVTGRGVFAVRTLGTAVSVESVFLEESGNLLRMPAIFPNRAYALDQLEVLTQLINRHFDEIDNQANKPNT